RAGDTHHTRRRQARSHRHPDPADLRSQGVSSAVPSGDRFLSGLFPYQEPYVFLRVILVQKLRWEIAMTDPRDFDRRMDMERRMEMDRRMGSPTPWGWI